MVEKAESYGAFAVFFEAARGRKGAVAQAFIFVSDSANDDDGRFALVHKRLWSWGGVPLLYRASPGLVQLFRCAHQPDFMGPNGQPICRPVRTLRLASDIAASEAWWDATRLRNGTIWDDPEVCDEMLSSRKAAHRRLVEAVRKLNLELAGKNLLSAGLRRRLLILCLLIAYLEERGVLQPSFFGRFKPGARKFFEVLPQRFSLIRMLEALEERFNGHVFSLSNEEQAEILDSRRLLRFARLVQGHEDDDGQLSFWQLYSFRDLPVEVISQIYQLFVSDRDTSVYTPPALVRLVLEETLSWEVIDRLVNEKQAILDPACGSGIFLVEAFKRLVVHWRSRHDWKKPAPLQLHNLLAHVCGVDIEEGAVKLAAFSLCLALCDSLDVRTIRESKKLFPIIEGQTVHRSCFFEARERRLFPDRIGAIVGNPPFQSKLRTAGTRRAAEAYANEFGALPDKQVAYLFLHEAMKLVAPGGVLGMLQQYGFLYNEKVQRFRTRFLKRWNVREILDFVSIRGLFESADTKVVVVVSESSQPSDDHSILHAVFRRSGRAEAEQGFDIDYYDLHRVSRALLSRHPNIWRANLLGGTRVLHLVERLSGFPTVRQFAKEAGLFVGEGFIEGADGKSKPAEHLIGRRLLVASALTDGGIDKAKLGRVERKPIEAPRSPKLFTPPLLVVRKNLSLQNAIWKSGVLTFKNEFVGFAANGQSVNLLRKLSNSLRKNRVVLQAFAAATSTRLFTRKATALSGADIMALPHDKRGSLDVSTNERIVASDVVDYYCDFVRLGDESVALRRHANEALPAFCDCYVQQVNTIYSESGLRSLPPQQWPGVICQPFVFGEGAVEWEGADSLRDKIGRILETERDRTLSITRIARIYDDRFIFLLKPDRLRYWLRSIALRDADETMAELRAQGF